MLVYFSNSLTRTQSAREDQHHRFAAFGFNKLLASTVLICKIDASGLLDARCAMPNRAPLNNAAARIERASAAFGRWAVIKGPSQNLGASVTYNIPIYLIQRKTGSARGIYKAKPFGFFCSTGRFQRTKDGY